MSQIPKDDSDWFDDLPEAAGTAELVTVTPVAVVKRTAEEDRLAKLRQIEDDLLQQSLTVMDDVHGFRDIECGQTEPPIEWIKKLGFDEAEKRLRVANAAWLSAKEAPVGLMIAQRVAIGIIKARSSEKAQSRSLNIALVQMTMPVQKPEEVEIE